MLNPWIYAVMAHSVKKKKEVLKIVVFNQIHAQTICHICLILDWWTYCTSILANHKIKAIINDFCFFFAENMIIIVSTVNKFPYQAFMQKLNDKKLNHKEKTTPCFVLGEYQTLLVVLTQPASTQVRGSTNQAIARLSHILEIGNESYILLSHCILNQNIHTNKILGADLPFQVNRWYIFFWCHFLFRRAWKYQSTKLNKTTEEIVAMNTKKHNI